MRKHSSVQGDRRHSCRPTEGSTDALPDPAPRRLCLPPRRMRSGSASGRRGGDLSARQEGHLQGGPAALHLEHPLRAVRGGQAIRGAGAPAALPGGDGPLPRTPVQPLLDRVDRHQPGADGGDSRGALPRLLAFLALRAGDACRPAMAAPGPHPELVRNARLRPPTRGGTGSASSWRALFSRPSDEAPRAPLCRYPSAPAAYPFGRGGRDL